MLNRNIKKRNLSIPKELHGIDKDLEKAVACFRPVLKGLNIRMSSSIGTPVFIGLIY